MRTTFTLLLSLTASVAFAQKDFQKGYYITNQGDTVSTYINDKNWNQNPREIIISDNEKGQNVSTLKLSKVSGFAIASGDVYVRDVVSVDKSPNRISDLVVGKEPVITTDTVFLQVLVRGARNLYYLKDENKKEHFYLQHKLETPQELILRRQKKEINDKNVVQVQEMYKNALSTSFADCPAVAGMVFNVKYTKNAMMDIFSKYNACGVEAEEKYTAAKEKFDLRYGALAGISQVNLEFSSFKGIQGINKTEFKGSSYTAGGYLDILLPRTKGKWSIYNELAIKPYKLEGHYQEQESANYSREIDFQFDFNYIGLGTMVRYTILPKSKVQPFVNIGVANNFLIKDYNYMVTTTTYFDKPKTESGPVFESTKAHEMALLAGAGFKYKRFGGELRYEVGDGMTRRVATVTKHMTSFILSYTFN